MQKLVPALCLLLLLVPVEGLTELPLRNVDPARDNPSSTLTVELIKGRAGEIAASTGISEAVKTSLAELYRRSIEALDTATAYEEAARRLERAIDRAPLDVQRVSAEVERKGAEVDAQPLALTRLSLPELQQVLLEETGKRASTESRLSQINSQILKEQNRPAAIRQRLSDANGEIRQAESMPLAVVKVDEIPELAQARSWANEARIVELRAETLMLSQELASHPMRLKLLQAQQRLAKLDRKIVQGRVQQIEAVANELRLGQSEQAKIEAEVAELVAADKAPPIVRLAERNTRLSKEVETLAAAINDINRRERAAAELAQRVEESFNATRKKTEIAGVSQVLGQVLQEQRRSLPDVSKARRMAGERGSEIAEISLAQILLEEERGELQHIDAYIERLSSSVPPDERTEIAEELTQLANSRSGLIEQALTIQRSYLYSMGELDIAQRRLESIVGQFDEFLAERLLWVRSSRVAGLESMRYIPGQLAGILASDKWSGVVTTLGGDAASPSGWVWHCWWRSLWGSAVGVFGGRSYNVATMSEIYFETA